MAATYDVIASYTFPSSLTSYQFSSIPNTYDDLVITMNFNPATGSNTSLWFQYGFSGTLVTSGYTTILYYSNGSASAAEATTSDTIGYLNGQGIGTSTDKSGYIFHINQYKNTVMNKSAINYGGNPTSTTSSVQTTGVTTLSNTGVIDTIKIFSGTTNFAAGTVYTLYGIKEA